MKSVDNAELILIKKIQVIKEKYKDIPELAELEGETLEIINQNCISQIQMATMYLLSSEGLIDEETSKKLKSILQNVFDIQAK